MLNYASKYPTQITTPDANYPLGGAQNVTSPGDGTGTPWDEDLINDIIGFFQALITETGITVSGNAETAVASDLWDALDNIYALHNAKKIMKNETGASPGTAEIGRGYTGNQVYGRSATGSQSYGLIAIGDQYYGNGATGDQYYGINSTGAIEIGASTGSAATKKLISGTKEATFEEIIDVATPWGAWQTISYAYSNTAATNTDYRQSMVCRKSSDGKNVQISGSINTTAGSSNEIGTLPSGYRPANRVSFAVAPSTAAGLASHITISKTTGIMYIYGDGGYDTGIEVTLPLD